MRFGLPGAPKSLALAAAFAVALIGGCARMPRGPGGDDGAIVVNPIAASGKAGASLPREDLLWLNRVTYGLDSATLAEYRHLGRPAFLDAQLAPRTATLPAPIEAQIDALQISSADPARELADVSAGYKRINAMPDGTDKEQARKALNDRGNMLAYEAKRRELLRAVYSPAQLQEQLVWFWLNHFSVYENKANLRWLLGDYAEHAIRPHALGHFRDLVLATLQHPAMLQYLDNAQNAVGHINENYARELLELHTLGVGAGYSQQDVQELARILTGVGVNAGGDTPALKAALQPLYRRVGAFEFNPARHDFGRKLLLGSAIDGGGFSEVEQAVTLIVHQPACARFISGKLATYFVADNPPPALVDRMAQTFQRTDGDIAAVLRTMFLAPQLRASLGDKFRDPMHYVTAAVRLAYDGRPLSNTHPLLNWLNALGEAPFGRQTPDGYPMTELAWASAGQMSRRFEIARAIGQGPAGLFDPEDGSPATTTGFPQLENRLYFDAMEAGLAPRTVQALNAAGSQQEWNTFLLSSPDFNYH